MPTERIQAAAWRCPKTGRVFEADTHADALNDAGYSVNVMENLSPAQFMEIEAQCGFTTTQGRFVDRSEAFSIASGQCQLIAAVSGRDYLLSEEIIHLH